MNCVVLTTDATIAAVDSLVLIDSIDTVNALKMNMKDNIVKQY